MYHRTLTGWDAAWFFVDFGLQLVIGIPLMILAAFVPRPSVGFSVTGILIVAGLFGLIIAVILLLTISENLPCWTLRVDRRRITLTFTTLFWTKERGLETNGANFRPVCFGFFERFWSWSGRDSFYMIEFTRNGETLMFPCENEKEQRRNFAKIEQMLSNKTNES